MNEKELLIHYRNTGDLVFLGKLYTPYMSLMYGVCYKYLHDGDRSQDAVMQIFEELVEKLKTHEIANFKSWLYVYTKNYCLMLLRKDKRSIHLALDDHVFETEQKLVEHDEFKWGEEDFDKLDSCIELLGLEQRVCVRLFYLEELCYKDIAERTGYELNKVKSAIQNGKRNLKICMEQNKYGK